jgi:GPI inositol-deacylase
MEGSLVEAQPGRPPSRSRNPNPWSGSLLTLSLASLGIFLILSIMYSFTNRDLGADGCDVPVMSPTYIRMVGFDAEHTHFASKYNLYLYREEGVDSYTEENIGVGNHYFHSPGL